MIKALAAALVAVVPKSLGGHPPILTAITSMPASLLFDPDSYYFGVLSVLSSTTEAVGVPGVKIARAGDQGNTANVSLIPYDPKHYDMLRKKVTSDVVKRHFKGVVRHSLRSAEYPRFQFYIRIESMICSYIF